MSIIGKPLPDNLGSYYLATAKVTESFNNIIATGACALDSVDAIHMNQAWRIAGKYAGLGFHSLEAHEGNAFERQVDRLSADQVMASMEHARETVLGGLPKPTVTAILETGIKAAFNPPAEKPDAWHTVVGTVRDFFTVAHHDLAQKHGQPPRVPALGG